MKVWMKIGFLMTGAYICATLVLLLGLWLTLPWSRGVEIKFSWDDVGQGRYEACRDGLEKFCKPIQYVDMRYNSETSTYTYTAAVLVPVGHRVMGFRRCDGPHMPCSAQAKIFFDVEVRWDWASFRWVPSNLPRKPAPAGGG